MQKNKLVFIDGSLSPPSTTSSLLPSWDRANEMSGYWIPNDFFHLGHLSLSILPLIPDFFSSFLPLNFN